MEPTRKWEIWKGVSRFDGKRRLTNTELAGCNKLHHRYPTKAAAQRVLKTMKDQGIICRVKKRQSA